MLHPIHVAARLVAVLGLLAPLAGHAADAPPPAGAAPLKAAAHPTQPSLDTEQLSYATGVSTVRNFARNKVQLDIDAVVRGMRDALGGGKALAMNEREIRAAMTALQVELRRTDKQSRREAAEQNVQRGQQFQAEFRQQPGVVALSNGILYRELRPGHGPRPAEMDQVVVQYRGQLIDGTEFDASAAEQPVTLRVVSGIMGWRETLKRMPVGARWQVVIPPMLAYGERGVAGSIGPNETLVFEIELLDLQRS